MKIARRTRACPHICPPEIFEENIFRPEKFRPSREKSGEKNITISQ